MHGHQAHRSATASASTKFDSTGRAPRTDANFTPRHLRPSRGEACGRARSSRVHAFAAPDPGNAVRRPPPSGNSPSARPETDGRKGLFRRIGSLLRVLLAALLLLLTLAPPQASFAQTAGTVPSAPRNLEAAPGDARVALSWEEPSTGGDAITGYEVRHAEGASVPAETAWRSAGTGLTATVAGLANGTAYAFEVRALIGQTASPAARTQSTPATVPGAPQNLRARGSHARVDIIWRAPANTGGSDLVRYDVRYAEGTSVPRDAEWYEAGLQGAYYFTGLEIGTIHTFEVRAVNGVGAGPIERIQATPSLQPSQPRDLTATPGNGQITLTWRKPLTGGDAITRYEYRHAEGASVPTETAWQSAGADPTATVGDLTNDTAYTFEVRALIGQTAGFAERIQATPGTVPGALQSLKALPGNSSVILLWRSPANDGGFNIEHIQYRYAAGDAVPDDTVWIDSDASPILVQNLTNGTAYAFEMRAVNSRGAGPVTQVPSTPGASPTAPRNLAVTPGGRQVTLSWIAPANNGGHAVTRYEYRHAAGASVPAETAWRSAGTNLSATVENLVIGTAYTFEVRAVSEFADGVSATIAATPEGRMALSVSAVDARVTKGDDVRFTLRRSGSTANSVQVHVDLSGHRKIMGAESRRLAQSSNTGGDVSVTLGPGETETTLTFDTEADRVNEGNGEIAVSILDSPQYVIAGAGTAATLVEDDDIPEVSLRWISPAMTLRNNVWTGSMVEGQDIEFEVVCSGNTLAPGIHTHRMPLRIQENLNHPRQPHYNIDWTLRYPCAGEAAPLKHSAMRGSRYRYVGPANGQITVDLFQQVLRLDDLPGDPAGTSSLCYLDETGGSPEEFRFCPRITLGAARSARIEVLNRNPTVVVEALQERVNEGEPASFRLTRIWTSDWLSQDALLGASATTVDYTTSATGDYVASLPSGTKTFERSWNEIIVVVPTANDDVAGPDGMVTFELLPGTDETQASNFGGHYEVYDQLDGITPPGKSSRTATVRILNDDEGRGIVLSALTGRVPEGLTWTYTVALRSQPTGPVTVTPSVTGSPDVTVSPATLTFTAEDWNQARTVTVSAADDDDAVNDTATVDHAVSGADYGSVTAPGVTVTVEEDDGREIALSAPRNLSATPGDEQVALTWDPPQNDGGSNLVRYEVRHAAGGSVPADTAWTGVGLDRTHDVSGLTNGTLYTFQVRAVNGQGAGPAAQVQSRPAGVPSTPRKPSVPPDDNEAALPGAVRSLVATPGDSRVGLAWRVPLTDGGSDLVRYEVRHAAGGSVPADTAWTGVGLDRTHDVSGLTNGTLYTFQVRAVNGANPGNGPAASTTATPRAKADPEVARAVTGWLARFGRTVAEQALEAVQSRMSARPKPGVEARLAGQPIGGAASSRKEDRIDPGLQLADSRTVTARELTIGSSFDLSVATEDKGIVSVWGRGGIARLAGRDGDLSLDGEVSSGMLGTDWTHERWTTGLLVSHSVGDGGYRSKGSGAVSSSLTGLFPWARHTLNERISAWGVAGYGRGSFMLAPDGEQSIETDLNLWMAASGLRGVLFEAGEDGPTLTAKTDAMFVRMTADAVAGSDGDPAAVQARATRLRLGLEGSRPFPLENGAALTPSIEIGLRRDGGDAETGFGADLGAGLAWVDPKTRLRVELRGRGLLTHEARDFRNLGLEGSLAWDPRPGSDRGPRLSLTQSVGASSRGGADALLERPVLEGLVADDDGDELERRRLETRFTYGFSALGDRFTSTPGIGIGLSDAGNSYSLGWHLTRAARDSRALELSVEARRRDGVGEGATPEHEVRFGVRARY